MTIRQSLHTKSRLFRNLLMAVTFLFLGFFYMPINFLGDEKEFRGLMSGMSLGFGFAWLISTLLVAKAAGQINDQHQLNFDDKE